jgi:hypothetical protein
MNPEWMDGLIGGLIIGIAASAFLLINGRILGASGILGGLVDLSGRSNAVERLSFLIGLICGPIILTQYLGLHLTGLTSNPYILISSALLVGIGTRLANGCTSGHGVCGLSRFSFRGIFATIFYLLSGILTIIVFKNLFGIL